MKQFGYLISGNAKVVKNKIKYATENEYNINRFHKLLSNLGINYQIEMIGNTYTITFGKEKIKQTIPAIETEQNRIKLTADLLYEPEPFKHQDKWKAILRGSFLGAGSLNEPSKKYHLEVIFAEEQVAKGIQKILEAFSIKVKILKKKKETSIYSKEGEEISKILAFIGASTAVLKYEEIRVMRDTRNSINRLVNCETANINKTIVAAVEQIEAINQLKKAKKFEELPEALKEIAELRCQHPDASLIELGQKLTNPIGKSGVNHRLKKLQELAAELKR